MCKDVGSIYPALYYWVIFMIYTVGVEHFIFYPGFTLKTARDDAFRLLAKFFVLASILLFASKVGKMKVWNLIDNI
jgi:hypothetical protein